MRLLSEGIGEAGVNLRWGIALSLQLIEEVVCAPQASMTGGLSMEESKERLRRAVQQRDTEAEDAAFVDCMRAQVRERWKDFSERRLLADLYQREARRREKGPSRDDNRRRPTHAEGLQVAKALLPNIAAAAGFDFEWESDAVSIVLADRWVALGDKRRSAALRYYIDRSRSSRAHFDALGHIVEKLDRRGEPIPRPLARWREEVAGELRRRPARKPIPSHRPVKPAQLVHDVEMQFAIEVLRRVGIPPMGTPVSGCRIVSEALKQIAVATGRTELALSEDTVTRVWKARVWEKPFEPVLRKHSKAIAERTGPFRTH